MLPCVATTSLLEELPKSLLLWLEGYSHDDTIVPRVMLATR